MAMIEECRIDKFLLEMERKYTCRHCGKPTAVGWRYVIIKGENCSAFHYSQTFINYVFKKFRS